MKLDATNLNELEDSMEPAKQKIRPSKIIATVLTILLLVSFTGAFLFQFIKTVPTIKDEFSKVTYPVKGEYVEIEGINTAWKRTDEMKASSIQQLKLDESIVSIPNATITISKKTKECKLRILFANDKKRYVGDPVNLEVKNGVFTATGTKSINLLCTEGFDSESDFRAYKQGIILRWSVDILEGSKNSSSMLDFKKIVSQEINPLYR